MPHALKEFLARSSGWWIAACTAVVTGWPALLPGDRPLVTSFTDDAFFYFNIARHVAAGHGFTFDGSHPTNGFQPLWQFILVPLFRLVPGDFLPLRCVILLQSILLAACGALIWGILRSRVSAAAAAATPLFLIGLPGARLLWTGMESSLVLALLVGTWRAWLRVEDQETPPARDWWVLGSCCALLFLARLEGGAALPVTLGLAAARLRRSPRPAPALVALVAPTVVTVGGYLAWNIVAFGTWLPISGQVKMHWMSELSPAQRLRALFNVDWAGRYLLERLYRTQAPPAWGLIGCGLALFAALALAWRCRAGLGRSVCRAAAPFIVLTCAAMALIDHVVLGPFLGEWVLVPIHLLTVIGIGLLAARSPRVGRALVMIGLALCLLRIPSQALAAGHQEDTFAGRSLRMAEWIRERTPPDARIGTLFAGELGYFGHRTVVNLDGLVNSIDYYRRVLVGDGWEAYLRSERLLWLADVGCVSGQPLKIRLPPMGRKTGNADGYSLVHLIRDPDLPENCGLSLWRASPLSAAFQVSRTFPVRPGVPPDDGRQVVEIGGRRLAGTCGPRGPAPAALRAGRRGHPGGQVKRRPPSRCRWRWNTDCPALSRQLATTR